MSLALVLLVLHTVDGYEVSVNPSQITVLHPSSEAAKRRPNQLIAKGVRCVVGLSDGKFISVTEDCATVRQSLQQIESAK